MGEVSETEATSVSSHQEKQRRDEETSLLQLGVGLVSGIIMIIFIMAANPNAPAWAAILGGAMFGFFSAAMTAVIRKY